MAKKKAVPAVPAPPQPVPMPAAVAEAVSRIHPLPTGGALITPRAPRKPRSGPVAALQSTCATLLRQAHALDEKATGTGSHRAAIDAIVDCAEDAQRLADELAALPVDVQPASPVGRVYAIALDHEPRYPGIVGQPLTVRSTYPVGKLRMAVVEGAGGVMYPGVLIAHLRPWTAPLEPARPDCGGDGCSREAGHPGDCDPGPSFEDGHSIGGE